MLSISQASHIPTTISQAFFSTLGFDKSQIRFSNPKPSNPKLGICVWDMLANSNPKPRISQGGALGLGYAEHIPSLANPNDDIPNLGFVLGICKSQTPNPNPKASRTQFGFWYDHDCCQWTFAKVSYVLRLAHTGRFVCAAKACESVRKLTAI